VCAGHHLVETGSEASTRIHANFFRASFAIEPESYLRLYPEIQLTPEEKGARFSDDFARDAFVGDGLAKGDSAGRRGDRIVLQVGIPTYGTQDFTFTIRGVYRAASNAVDKPVDVSFQWKYADERLES